MPSTEASKTHRQRPKVIRLLVSDLDGTLVPKSKVPTERTRQVIRQLRAAGIGFTVVSARPPRGMQWILKDLEITLPLAGFNGGLLLNPDFSVARARLMDPALVSRCIAFLETRKLDVWLYTADAWLVRDRQGLHVERETQAVRFEPKVVPAFDDWTEQAVKLVGVSDDYDAVAAAETEMHSLFAGSLSATRSQAHYLDITDTLANKGQVIHELSERLGISPDEIVTIGDMPTDTLMFAQSGFGIAMGNASEAVQACADAVTGTFEAEGFADAVERYVLQPSST